MNDDTKETQVEDVLDAYMTNATGPDWATLVEWIRRYPEYERELTDFAVAWSQVDALPEQPAPTVPEAERMVQRGLVVARNILDRVPAQQPIGSLIDEGRAHGLAPRQLAARLNLSSVLFAQLDRRLIRYATIPGELIERLAQAIGHESAAVKAYLQGGATFAAGAQFKADAAPMLAEPQDFAEAVRDDPVLSDEQRRYWLALAEQSGGAHGR